MSGDENIRGGVEQRGHEPAPALVLEPQPQPGCQPLMTISESDIFNNMQALVAGLAAALGPSDHEREEVSIEPGEQPDDPAPLQVISTQTCSASGGSSSRRGTGSGDGSRTASQSPQSWSFVEVGAGKDSDSEKDPKGCVVEVEAGTDSDYEKDPKNWSF